MVSAVLTSLVQAAEEYKSRTKAQFFKRQTARVARSSAYVVSHEMTIEENEQPSAFASPQKLSSSEILQYLKYWPIERNFLLSNFLKPFSEWGKGKEERGGGGGNNLKL